MMLIFFMRFNRFSKFLPKLLPLLRWCVVLECLNFTNNLVTLSGRKTGNSQCYSENYCGYYFSCRNFHCIKHSDIPKITNRAEAAAAELGHVHAEAEEVVVAAADNVPADDDAQNL